METLAASFPGRSPPRRRSTDPAGPGPSGPDPACCRRRGRYRFRHAITRDIAYGLLLYSQRHRACTGPWLGGWRTRYADDPDPVLAALAYHYRNSLSPSSAAKSVDRALDYLGRAGRRSLRSFAHREAIGFLSDAVLIASGGEQDGRPGRQSSRPRRSLTGCKPAGSRTWPRRISVWAASTRAPHTSSGPSNSTATRWAGARSEWAPDFSTAGVFRPGTGSPGSRARR